MDSSLFFNYLKRNNESPQLSWEEHALQLGIEVKQAFQFHNSYCDDANKCMSLKDVPSQFFSPKGLDLEIMKRNHPTNTIPEELAQLNPLSFHGIYKVIEHENSHTLRYHMKIAVNKEDEDYIIQYSTSGFHLNDEEEQGKMAQVALKCMESVEPIQLRCGEKFNHIRLDNHSEILSKWKVALPQLKEVYIDEYAFKYFEQFENNISDYNYFFERFSRQLPLQLVFALPFSQQNEALSLSTIHSSNPVSHKIIEKRSEDKFQFKSIKINGIATDQRSYEHIKFNLDVPIESGRSFRGKFSYELDINPDNTQVQGLQFTNVTSVDQLDMDTSIIAYRIGND